MVDLYKETAMASGILNILSAFGTAEERMDFLNASSYEELLEIDISRNMFRALYHMAYKYNLPVKESEYQDMYGYFIKNDMIHPQDLSIYEESMNPDTLRKGFNEALPKGIKSLSFRIKDEIGEWRRVEQLMVTGTEYGIPEGVIRCYIYDIQSLIDRDEGLRRGQHEEPIRLDSMTGLLRRRDFFREAGRKLKESDAAWIMIAIDLENFMFFNEWYGWEEGNKVLGGIGRTLREAASSADGLGGYMENDDFCLLVPENSVDINELYHKVHSIISTYSGSSGFLPAFGISRAEDYISVMNLVDQASLACSRSKGDYKNRIRYFSKAMVNKQDEEYHLLADFLTALSNGEICFALQPQCRSSSGAVVGAEALARWTRKDGSSVSPAYFVPILEKYGFITDLDQYIWRSVAAWLHDWLEKGNPLIPVSVNVSQIDIFTLDVPEYFRELAETYELPHKAIKIEITESAYAEDGRKVGETVHRLRELGFMVLMDDFGNGYSSLNMLRELEMDAIKLDARFLQFDKRNTETAIHILESVVNMAIMIGMPIIVEGVEKKEQNEFLMHLGCRYIQGYFFYKPMSPRDFEKLVAAPDARIDLRGFRFKANEQFHLREFLDETVYSDSMLNSVLGPVAIYAWDGENVIIIRYNEQFYEAVNVPDYTERLRGIEKYLSDKDAARLKKALQRAVDDRLNGASEILDFAKSNGTTARFLIHFYYIGEDQKYKRFYGSARDVSNITILQRQLDMITDLFSECIIFLKRNRDNTAGYSFQVVAQGLEEKLGLTKKELEDELNSEEFFLRVIPEQRQHLWNLSRDAAKGIDFSTFFHLINARGEQVSLFMRSDYVDDIMSDIQCVIVISGKQREMDF